MQTKSESLSPWQPAFSQGTTDRQPWERVSHESSKAYMHFSLYMSMGVTRSLRKLAEDTRCISKVAQLRRWSVRHGWVQRTQEYDAYQEQLLRLEQEKERRQMAKRHASIAVLGQNLVVSSLQRTVEELTQNPEKKLSIRDVTHLLDIAVKVERLARGEPTEISELEGSAARPLRLTVEEIAREAIENVLGLSSAVTERIEGEDGEAEETPAGAQPEPDPNGVFDPFADLSSTST